MISACGVDGRKNPYAAIDTAHTTVFRSSTRRKPSARRIAGAVIFIVIAPAAPANVIIPEANGDSPKPSCSMSGVRNGSAPIPMRNTKPPTTDARKVRTRNRAMSRIGAITRRACHAVDREQHHAADDQPGDPLVRQDPAPDVLEAEHRARQAEAHDPEAHAVERLLARLAHVRDEAQREREPEDPDRDVDQEDPAPREVGDDEAAERRADHRADQRGHGQVGHRRDELGLRNRAQHHEPPDRHHHRAAHALHDRARARARAASSPASSRSSRA